MKLRYFKAKHWLLLSLMGLLGFVSCGKDNNEEEPRTHMDYGVIECTFNPGN